MRIISCFNWKLTDISKNYKLIKEQGFDAVQINPIQPLKEDGIKEWWMSYQPVDFKIGNVFGTKEELINLCNRCNEVGLRVYADAVINHMGADPKNNFKPHIKVNEKIRNNPEYWKEKVKVTNWKDRQDVINHCIDLPGLNVYNKDVEDTIVNFLNELIDCGITGFRFDAAKSIGLPSEGYNFWPNLIYRLKKYGMFLYGEVIFEEDKKVIDEYAKYMHVLGNYDGSNKDMMVKFVENHDTFLSDDTLGYTKNISSKEILKWYKDMIMQYKNTLFYTRPFDDTWKSSEIKEAHKKAKILEKKVG